MKTKIKIVDEFKQFLNKGDIFDLAAAIVLGTAFNAVVNSLANKVISPLISFFIDGFSMDSLVTVLRPEVLDEAGEVVSGAVVIDWGTFILAMINFLVTALLVFIILKLIKLFRKGVRVIEVHTKEEAKRALAYFDGDPSTPAPRPKKEKRKKGEKPQQPAEEKPAEPVLTEEQKQSLTLSAILENLQSINAKLSSASSGSGTSDLPDEKRVDGNTPDGADGENAADAPGSAS